MTLIVGIKCTDGIVLAAEKDALPGTGVVDVTEDVKKIHKIENQFLVALGGFSGQGHRYLETIRRLDIESENLDCFQIQEAIHEALQPIVKSIIKTTETVRENSGLKDLGYILAEALVAYVGSDGPCLLHVNHVAQCDPIAETVYQVIGEGEKVAVPFLSYIKRFVWGDKAPNVSTAIMSALWMFHFAHNCAGKFGPPWMIATLQPSADGAASIEILDENALDPHHRLIDLIEGEFGKIPMIFQGEAAFQMPTAGSIGRSPNGARATATPSVPKPELDL
jgi:hypothetical protein